ncbi:MAG: immunoglobulin domain-containing protein [Verrucomicrobiota bacterium]
MKSHRLFSLGLAMLLQVMPLSRVFFAVAPAAGSSYAIIAMWLGGAAALLGSVDAVSGASSISVSPSTGTVGTPYSGAVQYSGSHASSAKSWQLTKNWLGNQSGCNSAYEIAPGLWLTNSGSYLVRVGGTPTASGTYSFTLKIFEKSGCGSGNTDTRTASITISGGVVVTPPGITTQPTNRTVTAGTNTSLSVVATGTAPLVYQWRRSSTNLAGATSATLSFTNITLGQAGNYDVIITNAAGSITSSVAVLTVNPAPVAPSITTQPTNQTVFVGANVTFSVTATGTAPLLYQWRRSSTNLPGATSSNLFFSNVALAQAGTYDVVINNAGGSITSSVAVLTVNALPVAPQIASAPTNQTVFVGGNVLFTVTATGTATLNYQWRQNGTNLSFGTAASLSLTNVSFDQAGDYDVIVTNSVGSVTSSVAVLTVNPLPVAPSITVQPTNQTVFVGGNVTFSVTADGTAPLLYQWRRSSTNLPGATSSNLFFSNVALGQAGNYDVVIKNAGGSITSSVVVLTVNPLPVAPQITSSPTNQTVFVGGNALFAVTATGTATLNYQWRQNGTNLASEIAPSLSLTNVSFDQAGDYDVIVTNSVGSVTSSVAVLTVNPLPVAPLITVQPTNQTVTVGSNATLTVSVDGTAPFGYQWRFNGTNLANALSSSLALNSITTGQGGDYSVVVTNIAGSVTSAVATVTVYVPPVAPSITTQPTNRTVIEGQTVSFSVAASGTGPLFYQWRWNGTNLDGEVLSSLMLTNVSTNQLGSYDVVVSNVVASVTSSNALLTVNPVPVADVTPPQINVTAPAAGQTYEHLVSLQGTASDNVGVSNVWYSVNGSAFNHAATTNDWATWSAAAITLSVGTNVLRAFAEDTSGNVSLTNSLVCFYTPSNALTLKVTGAGKITGATNGQLFATGKLLKIKAVPLTGSIVSNWFGTVDDVVVYSGSAAAFNVPMVPRLKVQANFVPNPFPAVAGQFNGLFSETNGVTVATAGAFTLTLNKLGAYTASVWRNNNRHALSGVFDAGGHATNRLTRSGTNFLTVEWAVDLQGSDQISGTLTEGLSVADLVGDRSLFNAKTNPCPWVGKYTFVLPGEIGSTNSPEGFSYGTVVVASNGVAKLSGTLADKTVVTRSAPISKNGEWPLWAALTSRKGLLMGWASYQDRSGDDFNGQSFWITPAKAASLYYPSGFVAAPNLLGSRYTPPVGSTGRMLPWTNGVVTLQGGNLDQAYTNDVVLGTGHKLTGSSTNIFAATFVPATGLFKGTFKRPSDKTALPLGGVVFQKTTNAFGFLPGKTRSASVDIEPVEVAP